jgi:hypothetical protein
MSKARTTLYPNGVSNADANTFSALENLRTLDNFKYFGIADDFDQGFLATLWSVAGDGTEVVALAAGHGGILSIATGGTDTNNASLTAEALNILFSTTKELWFRATLEADVVSDSTLYAGITDGAADPVNNLPEDGIFFRKDDGDASIDFIVRSGDAEVVTELALGTIVAATVMELAFHYDGQGGLRAYIDDALVYDQRLAAAALPAAVLMTGQVFVETGATAAVTVLLDNLLAQAER